MTFSSSINLVFSILTVIGQIVILVSIFLLIFKKEKLLEFISRNAVLFSFIVAFLATAGSLIYSDVIGYEPCKLCWFQRIFMYSQVVLLGMALWKKERKFALQNSIALSIIGAVIAGYHYLLQINVVSALPCSAVGYSISCSQRFAMNFGYITIPMMAFSAFLLIILFSYTALRKQKTIS